MNENIDLTKILKDCPKGTEFYHAAYGRVWFRCINLDCSYPIRLSFSEEISDDACVTSKGFIHKNYDGECLLFPSKDQRDWSKFTAPWYKKERFDPKTLKPFDKVLVRDEYKERWLCRFFSHIEDGIHAYKYATIGSTFKYCIPYNDDTKHLAGTNEEAPEYYRYWEE